MTPALQDGPVTVFHGDALDVLREMADESVHCVVTSPPYWGLRNYNEPGQLGLEATPDEYVANMVRLFREVRRVLRRDAVCFLNLGDSYASSGNADSTAFERMSQNMYDAGKRWSATTSAKTKGRSPTAPGLKPKDLVMMPARVAMALQADGWYLRSDIIWSKPNPMPESVTDRPTNSHEHVFLLTRSPRYFYDADAVREAHSENRPWGSERRVTVAGPTGGNYSNREGSTYADMYNPAGRNLRSVWQIATQPYSEAHFATYPEALCIPCIKAGTSEKGCCPACGAPWRRVVEMTDEYRALLDSGKAWRTSDGKPDELTNRHNKDHPQNVPVKNRTTGWEPTCDHGREPVPCTVLDPFAGSGTTLAVARRLGRRSVGIELSQSYIDTLIRPRVTDSALPLLEWLEEQGA